MADCTFAATIFGAIRLRARVDVVSAAMGEKLVVCGNGVRARSMGEAALNGPFHNMALFLRKRQQYGRASTSSYYSLLLQFLGIKEYDPLLFGFDFEAVFTVIKSQYMSWTSCH
ncbi:hypothetical protein TcasGA2_TC006479 [Tribolium castaneum]|uniref:Uncharacterized protein n=1 Tax=Tribolium castaneum TaxID=7070 RepID=D6WX39_TRICA|nr:hypothetical protein TcasGA2_TC006479 [Tribolium castaneum]